MEEFDTCLALRNQNFIADNFKKDKVKSSL